MRNFEGFQHTALFLNTENGPNKLLLHVAMYITVIYRMTSVLNMQYEWTYSMTTMTYSYLFLLIFKKNTSQQSPSKETIHLHAPPMISFSWASHTLIVLLFAIVINHYHTLWPILLFISSVCIRWWVVQRCPCSGVLRLYLDAWRWCSRVWQQQRPGERD